MFGHTTVPGNRVGFKSGFGFEPVGFGFGFGFKKKGVGFGLGFGFKTKGWIWIWIGIRGARICTSLVQAFSVLMIFNYFLGNKIWECNLV